MGAKVLHPRSIPPLRRHGIPLHVLSTDRPEAPGTVISAVGAAGGPQVKAISSRGGITLISMDTVGMWQEVGFLARRLHRLRPTRPVDRFGLDLGDQRHGLARSRRQPARRAGDLPPAADLAVFCEPRVIAPTASLSLVGRGIRAILHELGPVMEAFEELKVHLLTQSASDLNLTFLVDEEQSERLVRQLHGLLFAHKGESALFGSDLERALRGSGGGGRRSILTRGGTPAGASCWSSRPSAGRSTPTTRRPCAPARRRCGRSTPWAGCSIRSRRTATPACCGCSTMPGSASSASRPPSWTTCWPSSRARHRAAPLHSQLRAARGVPAGLRGGGAGDRGQRPSAARMAGDLPRPRGLPAARSGAGEGASRPRPHRRGAVQVRPGAGADGGGPRAARRLRRPRRRAPRSCRQRHPHARRPGARWRSSWRRPPSASPACGCSISAAAWGCRSGRSRARSTSTPWASCCGASRRPTRASSSGSSRGASWWRTAGVLLARVTQVKRKGEVTYVGLETGMNSLIRPALYGAYHPHREPLAARRAGHLDRPRRGPDLRDRRHPRPLAPPAADRRGGRDPDRQRRRLRAGDELALQPARAGGGGAARP